MKREQRTQQRGSGILATAAGRLRRQPLALGAALIPALAASLALAAGSPPKPATPSITAHPADPTNQTTALFNYSSSTAGASYECQLDGAAFASCPATGKSYSGPIADGKHTFKVRTLAAGKTSGDATYSWTVDTTAPSAAVSFPVDGSALSSAAWGHGCPGHAGICGSARDSGGIAAVSVSIRQGSGKWWGGSGFDRSTETFQAATLS